MKNNLKITLSIIAFAFIFGCATNSFAQSNGMVGAYGPADVANKEVIAAANFAVKKEAKRAHEKIKLISIKAAQQQVVAGMNYHLCLSVEATKHKKSVTQEIDAVVYENIKQKYSLTSWKEGACTYFR